MTQIEMVQLVIGWIAVAFHVGGYSYKTSKLLKNKQTHSLSWATFTLNFIGSTLWLLNGVLLEKLQPSLTNIIVLTSVAIILFYIVRHNHGWSEPKALVLLISLLAIAWGIFIMHLCDMYVNQFLGDTPSVPLQATIAVVSSIFTIVLFVPQLIKMFKTKDTKNVSYILVMGYGISNVLWVIFYATMFSEKPTIVIIPIMIAGIVSAIIQTTISLTKYIYEKRAVIA